MTEANSRSAKATRGNDTRQIVAKPKRSRGEMRSNDAGSVDGTPYATELCPPTPPRRFISIRHSDWSYLCGGLQYNQKFLQDGNLVLDENDFLKTTSPADCGLIQLPKHFLIPAPPSIREVDKLRAEALDAAETSEAAKALEAAEAERDRVCRCPCCSATFSGVNRSSISRRHLGEIHHLDIPNRQRGFKGPRNRMGENKGKKSGAKKTPPALESQNEPGPHIKVEETSSPSLSSASRGVRGGKRRRQDVGAEDAVDGAIERKQSKRTKVEATPSHIDDDDLSVQGSSRDGSGLGDVPDDSYNTAPRHIDDDDLFVQGSSGDSLDAVPDDSHNTQFVPDDIYPPFPFTFQSPLLPYNPAGEAVHGEDTAFSPFLRATSFDSAGSWSDDDATLLTPTMYDTPNFVPLDRTKEEEALFEEIIDLDMFR